MDIDLKRVIPGATCDFIHRRGGKRCGKPACQEFLPMPVAGPSGKVEFLPGAQFAYLCAEHTAKWLDEVRRAGDVSMGSK